MVDSLKRICDLLGVDYPELDIFVNDCLKSQYLIDRIVYLIGGE